MDETPPTGPRHPPAPMPAADPRPSGRGRARARKISLAIAAIFLLAVGAVAIAPHLLNRERLRAQLTAQLSRLTGRTVQWSRLRVSFFPTPSVVLDQVTLSMPASVDVRIASVTVSPRLLPLLTGRLRLATLAVRSPHIVVHRLPSFTPRPRPPAADFAAAISAALASALADVSLPAFSPLAGAALIVSDGTAELPADNGARFGLQKIDARVDLPPALRVDLRCTSSAWESLALHATVNTASAQGEARLDVASLRPHLFGARLLPSALQLGSSSVVSFALHVTMRGVRALRVELDGAIPSLTVRRERDAVTLRSPRLEASAGIDGEATQVTLTALQLDDPRAQLSGSLAFSPGVANLAAQGADVDVDGLRRVALLTGARIPLVRKVFSVLHGGTVPRVTFHSHAPTLAALGDDRAFVIRGRLVAGTVYVPGPHLQLEHVSGDATVADGTLIGEHLSGRLKKSAARAGTLRLGLSGKAPVLHLETQVQADAGELQALLERLVKDDTFHRIVDHLDAVTGTIAGQLTLAGTTKDVTVTAAASTFDISGRTGRLSDPFRIQGRYFVYTPRGMEADGATLTAGQSTMTGITARVVTGGKTTLDLSAGASRVVLEEAYPWLAASGWLPQSMWTPTLMRGTLLLRTIQLSGPIADPIAWHIGFRGSVQRLEIRFPRLPHGLATRYPLSIPDLHVEHDAAANAVAATVATPRGLKGAVDLIWSPARLDIRRLHLRDAHSNASLALRLTPEDVSVSFKGLLSKATFEDVLGTAPPAGSIDGDARIHIERRQPAGSSIEGRLEVRGLIAPLPRGSHVRIDSAVVEGISDTATVAAVIAAPGGTPMQLHGLLTQSPRAPLFDFDLAAGHLDWAAIEPLLARRGGTAPHAASDPWRAWLRGTLRVAAQSFSYGGFTWKPLRAVVALSPGRVSVRVSDATVCGVATPGTITFGGQGVALAFKSVAADQRFATLLKCVGMDRETVTGRYDLDGSVSASGAPADLVPSLQGHFELRARDGRLYGMSITARVLSLLSVVTGALGNLPNITKEGLPYDRISVRGDVKEKTLVLREGVLDGPSVKWVAEGSIELAPTTLDLTLLVAPFTTLDAIVSRIPIIGRLLGGNLISVPVKVTGDPRDPDLTPLPPAAVGKGLVGLMTRTVELPLEVVQPLLLQR